MKIPLKHLMRLTTDIGLVQHCLFSKPDLRFGYSIDDNARGIIVLTRLVTLGRIDLIKILEIYLSYIERAVGAVGNHHNFADKSGNFIDETGSGDSFGRAFWSMGVLINANLNEILTRRAEAVRKNMMKQIFSKSHIRTKAFILMGLTELTEKKYVDIFSKSLAETYLKNKTKDWRWFETKLTYSNAIIPLSLLRSCNCVEKKVILKVALESLNFLNETCQIGNFPSPIGSSGWYEKGFSKSIFDQQLIDAADMVMAAKAAWMITREENYRVMMNEWFRWFHGNNIHNLQLVNNETEGCYDGLTKDGINKNQGAESILAYLLALSEII